MLPFLRFANLHQNQLIIGGLAQTTENLKIFRLVTFEIVNKKSYTFQKLSSTFVTEKLKRINFYTVRETCFQEKYSRKIFHWRLPSNYYKGFIVIKYSAKIKFFKIFLRFGRGSYSRELAGTFFLHFLPFNYSSKTNWCFVQKNYLICRFFSFDSERKVFHLGKTFAICWVYT